MKKGLMIFLAVVFIILTLSAVAFFRYRAKTPEVSVEETLEPTPTPTLILSPTLSPNEELLSIESDLERIKKDISTIIDDNRFNPPVFNFDQIIVN
jgi:hypothetical protein